MANETPQISLMEQKLPDDITENLLLEGINSSELLNNSDLCQLSNILAKARSDLSAILNKEVDDIQFEAICRNLLAKTSEEIKIKHEKAAKPKSDINDIYAHLKRQPCPVKNKKMIEKKKCQKPISTKDKQKTSGSDGWKAYMSQMRHHKNNLEPGSMNVDDSKSDSDEEDEGSENIIQGGITLMGDHQVENKKIKFKNSTKEKDSESDDSGNEETFIKSNVLTMMGHETTE